jgi:hypothetical protein
MAKAAMELQPITDSSLIAKAGHEGETFTVQFQPKPNQESGAVVEFYKFPSAKYALFLAAESKGKWFNEFVRGRHAYKEVSPAVRKKPVEVD